MATPDDVRRRGRWSLVVGTLVATFLLAAIAYADNVVNTLDTSIDATKEAMSLTVGGGNGSTFVWVQNVNVGGGDTTNACNLAGAASLTVNVQSTNPSVATVSPSTITIADCSNGNTADSGELAKMGQVTVTPIAAGSADVTFSENAFNGSGIFNYATATFTVNVSAPANAVPTADAGGPYSGSEGAPISLDGTNSSDTGGSIASYAWTVTPHSGGVDDPDGGASCAFVDGTTSSSVQPKVACTDDGAYDVALTVTDDDGAGDGDTSTLTLTNANPSGTPSFPGGDVDEGDSFTLELTGANDPGANDPLEYQFDCGDGGGYDAPSSTPSRTCATNDNASRSVKLKVFDDDGGVAEYTGTVSVVNLAPTADGLAATSPINEGGSSSLSLTSPTDASSVDQASLRYAFACDGLDGSLAASYAAASASNAAPCNFADNGSFTVKGRVYDKDGGATTYDATVVVNNVPPTVDASFTAASVDCQTTATLTIDPADVGVNDSPWKVTIDWDDGTTQPEITRTDLDSFTVTHVYAVPATYDATVAVTDKDGGTGSDLANGITIDQTYSVDFLPPFDDSSPSSLISNKMKNGRVVPVKAKIYDDCVGSFVTDPATDVTIKVSKTAGGGAGDPVEEYADAGQSSAGTNGFRWSPDGFWIYNLDSKALGLVVGNNYRVDIYVGAVKTTDDSWAVLQPVK